ncbi:23S rRNA pseudouridine(955/2504/2580) synthase RluC [Sodalis sp. CWE]|uniref:23S rRNA pseudouridine(955/2504/2580) synthase RluC n=1 Tax=Sodalis sp. CWE TaxID=2803816 RepID=UPI001C7DB73C|nr:23S rRNA pseudouridine(955/2504/2580) synthase RluC [Sodalis sp. CWE]MBX4181039.1 23S rRNA pseudouridine(955/2504/2580) synthase RluC [Sodalis sp. CWE]
MKINNFGVQLINVSEDISGQRISNFLFTYLKDVPESAIYRFLRKGNIRVNKKRVKPEYKLQNNDKLRIPPIQRTKQSHVFNQLNKFTILNADILYEDKSLLILNKPSGTAVHGGSGLNIGLIEYLRALRPTENFLALVHRLDKETSGVLLIAKKRSVLRTLHEQMRAKKIQKEYLALVRGHWKPNVKVISAPLLKYCFSNSRKYVMQINAAGKPSETLFKIEERFRFATLVRASPITGRTHQIRAHAQYAGHPIAFDDRYGDKTFNRKLKSYGITRLFLHAISVRFNYPKNGNIFQIKAPMDLSLHQCLSCLRRSFKEK